LITLSPTSWGEACLPLRAGYRLQASGFRKPLRGRNLESIFFLPWTLYPIPYTLYPFFLIDFIG
jgi:hypothetical protein